MKKVIVLISLLSLIVIATISCSKDNDNPTGVTPFPDFGETESWSALGINHAIIFSYLSDRGFGYCMVVSLEEPQTHLLTLDNVEYDISWEEEEGEWYGFVEGFLLLGSGGNLNYSLQINESVITGSLLIPYTPNVSWQTNFNPNSDFDFSWSIQAKPNLYNFWYDYEYGNEYVDGYIQISKDATSYSLDESLFPDAEDDYYLYLSFFPTNYNYSNNDLVFIMSASFYDIERQCTRNDRKELFKRIAKNIIDCD